MLKSNSKSDPSFDVGRVTPADATQQAAGVTRPTLDALHHSDV